MPKTFNNINLCVVGKFEDADKMPGWLRYHGGETSKKIDSRVTHLVATEEAFRGDAEAVRKARELGIHIVHCDWLYDSLSTKPARPKPVASYLWHNLLQPELRPDLRPRKRASQVTSSSMTPRPKKPLKDPFLKKKPARNSKTVALPKEHIYVDAETQSWDVTLQRITTSGKREKFRLAIFESVQEPVSYSAFVKHTRVGKGEVSMIAPPKSNLNLAQTSFKKFFKLQTGMEWDERDESKHIPPKQDEDGNVLPAHEGWYHLARPSVLAEYMSQPQALPNTSGLLNNSSSPAELGDGMSTHDESTNDEIRPQTEDSGWDGDVDSTGKSMNRSFRSFSSDLASEMSSHMDVDIQQADKKGFLKRKASERDSDDAVDDDTIEGDLTENDAAEDNVIQNGATQEAPSKNHAAQDDVVDDDRMVDGGL